MRRFSFLNEIGAIAQREIGRRIATRKYATLAAKASGD